MLKIEFTNEIAEQTPGYKFLTDNQKISFKHTLNKYLNNWEFPLEHMPKCVSQMSSDDCLKVDFVDGSWLHFTYWCSWY